MHSTDNRRDPRFGLKAEALFHEEDRVLRCEISDISCRGAFVATEGHVNLGPGSGIMLDAQLPVGLRVQVQALVRWTRAVGAPGPPGFGVEFYGLNGSNLQFIEYYLEAAQRGAQGVTAADIHLRYRVGSRDGDHVDLRLLSLLPSEAEMLETLVGHYVAARRRQQLYLYLDVRGLGPSVREALDPLRRAFVRLREGRLQGGVLLSTTSIAATQIQRLSRESGIADFLMSFNERESADRLWERLLVDGDGGAERRWEG